MADQSNVPAYPEDHDCFKQLAAKKKISMKDLFHRWVGIAKEKKTLSEMFEEEIIHD